MTETDHRAFIEHYFSTIDQRRFDELAGMFAPDYVLHFDGLPAMGAEAAAASMAGYFEAFPDLQHSIEEILVEGDRAVARIVITATHQGDLMGIPATQRPVLFGATNIYHFANGQIVEHWVNADSLGMLQQIGAVPQPGT